MKKKYGIVLFVLISVAAKLSAQTVVVTDDNTYVTGQASSVLDVKSTSKGFLAPRMTGAQRVAISSPAEGLMVYQTDGTKGFYYYTNSAWTALATGTSSQWTTTGSNIYYNTGNVGIGINNPAYPLGVKDTLEIRRTGTLSELLFTNTAGSGDMRIAGDGGDVFWQGGGGRNLQMGAYWGIILSGDRQSATIPAFSNGVANTNVLALAQRDGSVPLAVQANSATQSANLMEWRSSAATLDVVDKNGNVGIGTTTPAKKLDVNGAIVSSATTYPNYAYNTANRMAFGETNVPANETGSVVQFGSGLNTRNMVFAFSKTGVNTSFFGNDGTQMMLGSESTSPITFRTGLVYSSANIMASGTEAMRLTSAGQLGIGTTTPSSALHVVGTNPLTLNGVQTGVVSDSLLTIASGIVRKLPFSTVTSGTSWGLTGNAGTSYATNFLGTTDNTSLRFRTNNILGMVLDSTGNVGIGTAPAFTAGTNQEQLLVDAGVTNSFNAVVAKGTVNNYFQLNVQNLSNGVNASSDVVATADNGSETINYVDLGINSSSNTQNIMGTANDAYLYTTGNNMLIGTGTAAKSLVFLTGGTTQSTNERMRIDGNGYVGIGTNAPTSDLTVYQNGTGAYSSRGLRFTGNSIGNTNSGSGFAMSLGYNISGNKQMWLGDADYLNNSAGVFIRYSSSSGATIIDAINGTNTSRKALELGIGGDASSGVVLGSDFNPASPTSYVWANGNMAIGASYRSNGAPANGLLVQGNTGIGVTSPTAVLHLAAGTASAGTAPLKLTSGTNLTTVENGAIEFDGTNYFATSGATRYTLAKTLTATASLNFPSAGPGSSSSLTITVTGAADGDVVQIGVPGASILTNSYYSAYVSSANTVTIRFNNTSGLVAQDPAVGTFRASIIKY